MPVMQCEIDGKPGYKNGDAGKCHTYAPADSRSELRARLKAELEHTIERRSRMIKAKKLLNPVSPNS